jgi:hypothetical protein
MLGCLISFTYTLTRIAWRVRCAQEETSESLLDKDMAMVVGMYGTLNEANLLKTARTCCSLEV